MEFTNIQVVIEKIIFFIYLTYFHIYTTKYSGGHKGFLNVINIASSDKNYIYIIFL